MGLAAAVAYSPTSHNDFTNWDDKDYLQNNKQITEPNRLGSIWDPQAEQQQHQYYPMVFTSFWIEHRLEMWWRARGLGVAMEKLPPEQHSFNPAIYHTTNLVLHAINAALVVWLMRSLGVNLWVAWLTAGLFALHPINAASVAWAAERKNVLSGMFYFLALILCCQHLRRGGWFRYAACLLLFVLALLSKTACLTLPATVLLCDWLIRGRPTARSAIGSLARIAPMLLLGLAAVWQTQRIEKKNAAAKTNVVFLEPELRPFAAAGAVWFYVGKVVAPVGFPGVYPKWIIPDHWPLFVTALLGLPLAGLGAWKLRRRLPPLALWGMGHYLLALSPMLGLIPFNYMQYAYVADHFFYLPGIGLFLCLALAADWARRRLESIGWHGLPLTDGPPVKGLPPAGWHGLPPLRQAMSEPAGARSAASGTPGDIPAPNPSGAAMDGPTRLGVWLRTLPLTALAAVALSGLGWATWRQCADVWHNATTYWEYTLRLNPKCWPGHYNLGNIYKSDAFAAQKQGNRDQAQTMFKKAADQYRLAAESKDGLYQAYEAWGQMLTQMGDLPAAVERYHQAVVLTPMDKKSWTEYRYRLAQLLVRLNRGDDAEEILNEIIAHKPKQSVRAHIQLGRLLRVRGQLNEAIDHYQRALTLNPRSAEARNGLEATRRAQQRLRGTPTDQ